MSEKHNIESFAIVLDGIGGIKETFDINDINNITQNQWVHLDYKDENIKDILLQKLGIEPIIADALSSSAIHMKFYQNESSAGTFLVLKNISDHSIKKNKEISSLRVWIDNNKIVTLCHNCYSAIDEIINKLRNEKTGPKNIIECFLSISQLSFHNVSDITNKILENVDGFEENVIKGKNNYKLNSKIGVLRRQIIAVHRYLLPQREIYKNLSLGQFFSESKYKNQLKYFYNDLSKSIDNLEYAREHMVILQEELENKVNISMNNNMYILSVIIAIFTPLTLLSGMLGMNLKGIPFADSDYAFGIVSIFMITIALILFWIVRRRKMI